MHLVGLSHVYITWNISQPGEVYNFRVTRDDPAKLPKPRTSRAWKWKFYGAEFLRFIPWLTNLWHACPIWRAAFTAVHILFISFARQHAFLTAHVLCMSVDKKNQLDVAFVFFISLLQVAQQVSDNHVPIIRIWRLRDVIASCWYVL